MSGSDAFLSRWSRRKLDERAATEAAPAAAPPATAAEPGPVALPAELPSLDDVTPESNLAAFFTENVPAALRNAALRKAWSLDPSIRDYVGDARDYAWDWNVPDGVPGFGPINAAYDVEGTIARMWAGPPEEEPASDAAVPLIETAPEHGGDGSLADDDHDSGEAIESEADLPGSERLILSEDDGGSDEDAPPLPRRKHGGATPM